MIRLTFVRGNERIQRSFLCQEVILGPNVPTQSPSAVGCSLPFFKDLAWGDESCVKLVEENGAFSVLNTTDDPHVHLDGKPLHKATIKQGDRLQIGDLAIEFEGAPAQKKEFGFEWDERSVAELIKGEKPLPPKVRFWKRKQWPVSPWLAIQRPWKKWIKRLALGLPVIAVGVAVIAMRGDTELGSKGVAGMGRPIHLVSQEKASTPVEAPSLPMDEIEFVREEISERD